VPNLPPTNLDGNIQQSPSGMVLLPPLRNGNNPLADYLPIRDLEGCVPEAVMGLITAHPHQPLDHTPAGQIRFSTPCPFPILLLLFRPTANPGIHRPQEGISTPMAFNPPEVPCKRNHPTDPPVLLRPEYLVTLPFSTLATIPLPIHYHQTLIPL
jgi:hypothetical protein